MNDGATLGTAQAAALALQHAMEADARVVVLGEDVGRGGIFGQYRGLQQKYGAARVIDTPISEATIMGAAVGMALAGLKPVVEMRVMQGWQALAVVVRRQMTHRDIAGLTFVNCRYASGIFDSWRIARMC